jgi:predicted esterase
MPSWFDIRSLDKDDGNEDEEGIKKASLAIQKMIQDEVSAGIPASRIILGGFSQGGALSLYTGLMGTHLLGGIVSLSGYLPIRKTITWPTVQKPPLLQCHGDADSVVLYDVGLSTSKLIQEKANLSDYSFKTYPNMGHSSCEEEMDEVLKFFHKNLPEN